MNASKAREKDSSVRRQSETVSAVSEDLSVVDRYHVPWAAL